jgi:hypothetical protein
MIFNEIFIAIIILLVLSFSILVLVYNYLEDEEPNDYIREENVSSK